MKIPDGLFELGAELRNLSYARGTDLEQENVAQDRLKRVLVELKRVVREMEND